MKEAGLEIRKKGFFSFISDIKGSDFYQKVAQDFVISKSELPTLLYIEKINLKDRKICKAYRITNVDLTKMTKELVFKFVKDVQKNKYYRNLRAEFPASDNENTNISIKKVIGRSYDKLIFNEKRKVLSLIIKSNVKCTKHI